MSMSATWNEPAVVVVSGIQAAGKTTVGRMLAERLPRAAFVDGDVLARMVVAGHEPMSGQASASAVRQLFLRYRQAALLADTFWNAGFTAVVADNIYGEDDLLWFIEQLQARPVILAMLVPQTRAVVERELSRASGAYRGWMGDGGLEAAVAQFQSFIVETPRIGLWLDTTGQTPDETVNTILSRAWTEGRVR